MPVFNGEKYLKEAIESILNQTFSDFEFLILNDGSTDRTEEIILSFDDQRIRYINNETNLGVHKTLNKALALSKGKYIARMDADDASLPNRFQRQTEFMEKNPDVTLCGARIKVINGEKTSIWKYPLDSHEIKACMIFKSAFAHPVVMIRKDFLEKEGLFYNESVLYAEDYELWSHLVLKSKTANLSEILLNYRSHDTQIGSKHSKVQREVSSEIKRSLLKALGKDSVTEAEMDLHNRIAYRRKVDFSKAEEWFLGLIKANGISKYCDDQVFKRYIGQLWANVCHQNAYRGLDTFRVFLASPLKKHTHWNLLKLSKFFCKCLSKFDYEKN